MPTLFNLIVNNVVMNWLAMTVEDQPVAHETLVLVVGSCMGLFHVDYRMVVSWCP